MRTIVHISDLHFGTEDGKTAQALLNSINEISPHIVINSGDYTQRARNKQYQAAAAFNAKIKFPLISVPGNHDVPLFDIIRRFFSPLTRYRKYITDNLCPEFEDDEIFVIGVNTARSFTWKRGRISVEQIAHLKKRLCETDNSKFKIVVTHHPFVPPPNEKTNDLVGRAKQAIAEIDGCSVDLILAGHAHKSYSAALKSFYPDSERDFVILQAGTAISKRHRGEPNSFNVIKVEKGYFMVSVMKYNSGKFEKSDQSHFEEKNDHWFKKTA